MINERNYGLQALRALAASSVVYTHLMVAIMIVLHISIDDTPAFYTIGVDVFFVISGVIMSMLISGGDIGVKPAIRFLCHRANRLMPVYLFALACRVAAGLYFGEDLLKDYNGDPLTMVGVARAALLLPSCVGGAVEMPTDCMPIIPVSWSLAYEVVFYMVCAVGVWRGVRSWGLIGLTGAALAVLVALEKVLGGGAVEFYLYPGIAHSMFFLFAAGIAVHQILPRLLPYAKFAAPAAVVIAAAVWLGEHSSLTMNHGSSAWAAFSVSTVIAFLLLGSLIDFKQSRVLSMFVWLGDRSYSLYLCHMGVVYILLGVVVKMDISPLAAVVTVLIGTPTIAVLISNVLYRDLERPANRLLNALLDRWLNGSEARRIPARCTEGLHQVRHHTARHRQLDADDHSVRSSGNRSV